MCNSLPIKHMFAYRWRIISKKNSCVRRKYNCFFIFTGINFCIVTGMASGSTVDFIMFNCLDKSRLCGILQDSTKKKLPVFSNVQGICQNCPLLSRPFFCAQTVTVSSDRLSRQWIVSWSKMEDGARGPVHSCRLHRGGGHSDLWR